MTQDSGAPAFGCGEGRHGSAHTDLDPVSLGLREPAEQQHHEVLNVARRVDAATEFGHPEIDAVVDEWVADDSLPNSKLGPKGAN